METDTKPFSGKCCSKCCELKNSDKFSSGKNICKECRNNKVKQLYENSILDFDEIQNCNCCKKDKCLKDFIKRRLLCKDCDNEKRRSRYNSNEEHRLKLIKIAGDFKHKKVIERRQKKIEEIGENNKKCNYCFKIKSQERFRHNRLKCKDCERDEPLDKFKRIIRSRIYTFLRKREKHSIEYLGVDALNYLKWISKINEKYTLENHGKEWHIDHVIPLSKFNLDDVNEQLIGFNWRNTMPLSVKENLSKNNRILPTQIEQHYRNLKEYHEENNIKMPEEFIDLFAKHLVDGDPLKSSLPLTLGNICEELG